MRIFLSTSLSARFEAKEERGGGRGIRMHLNDLSLGEAEKQDSNQRGHLKDASAWHLWQDRQPMLLSDEALKAKIALSLS